MKLTNILAKAIRKSLNESTNATNLVLWHGSNSRKLIANFYDSQFYTVNDYIAANYAYNFGGLLYEVKVASLNSFELNDYDKDRHPEKYTEMMSILKTVYDESVANRYSNKYFSPSPSSTFGQQGWDPIIKYCKENEYDSIKFVDESFDTLVHDVTYLIFNGNTPRILNVYDVEDAVESNFDVDYKKIK